MTNIETIEKMTNILFKEQSNSLKVEAFRILLEPDVKIRRLRIIRFLYEKFVESCLGSKDVRDIALAANTSFDDSGDRFQFLSDICTLPESLQLKSFQATVATLALETKETEDCTNGEIHMFVSLFRLAGNIGIPSLTMYWNFEEGQLARFVSKKAEKAIRYGLKATIFKVIFDIWSFEKNSGDSSAFNYLNKFNARNSLLELILSELVHKHISFASGIEQIALIQGAQK